MVKSKKITKVKKDPNPNRTASKKKAVPKNTVVREEFLTKQASAIRKAECMRAVRLRKRLAKLLDNLNGFSGAEYALLIRFPLGKTSTMVSEKMSPILTDGSLLRQFSNIYEEKGHLPVVPLGALQGSSDQPPPPPVFTADMNVPWMVQEDCDAAYDFGSSSSSDECDDELC